MTNGGVPHSGVSGKPGSGGVPHSGVPGVPGSVGGEDDVRDRSGESAIGPVAKRVYYSIGEVSVLTGLKPHVLRYWETQFDAVSPVKNRGGSRVYRAGDIKTILLVKDLLYQERFTIEGAKQRLAEMQREGGAAKESALRAEPAMLALIKEGLLAARAALALPDAQVARAAPAVQAVQAVSAVPAAQAVPDAQAAPTPD